MLMASMGESSARPRYKLVDVVVRAETSVFPRANNNVAATSILRSGTTRSGVVQGKPGARSVIFRSGKHMAVSGVPSNAGFHH